MGDSLTWSDYKFGLYGQAPVNPIVCSACTLTMTGGFDEATQSAGGPGALCSQFYA
jgi:hypothetical protein